MLKEENIQISKNSYYHFIGKSINFIDKKITIKQQLILVYFTKMWIRIKE